MPAEYEPPATGPAFKQFAEHVRRYCEWVHGDEHDLIDVRQLLLGLIEGIVDLKQWAEQQDDDAPSIHAQFERMDDLEPGWLADFPFQYYWEVPRPLDLEVAQHLDMGSIQEDLRDIYGELRTGLDHLGRNDLRAAAAHWLESYFLHWGAHAASAIHSIDYFFRQQGV